MSRIFDALQRAEGERDSTESTALLKGPELLREAERRASSDWEAVVSVTETEAIPEEENGPARALFAAIAADVKAPSSGSVLTAGERTKASNRFQSLPISVPQESHLACFLDRKSPTAEAIRLLTVRLRDMRRTRPLKKVVITSTIPREGKSTIASNLACALARRTEERVLLVEGDVRRPVVSRIFGFDQHPGLCDLLRNEKPLSDCAFRLDEACLWVLPAGNTAGSNPLELLQAQKLTAVMDQLSTSFDWIIIDSPPILPMADTSIWMRLSDGVLLVTRQGVTEKKQLKKGLEALEPNKVLGALLNGSKASPYSKYYYE